MSGINWGVGDILSVTKLAWDLYHNCYLVAREAPDEFRQLVNELASLQGVLRTLRDDINSDRSFLERLGENRTQTLERCLAGCFETLQKLQDLVVKYRKLGIGDGIQFWRKIKWVSQQGTIATLKNKVMVHTCNLSLCMSSIGNSSLQRIESSMMAALQRQEADPNMEEEAIEEGDVIKPLQKIRTAPAEMQETEGLGFKNLNRQMTGQTLVDRVITQSPESTPSVGSDECSEYTKSNLSPGLWEGPIPRKSRQLSGGSVVNQKMYPPSPLASDGSFFDSPRRSQTEKLPSRPESYVKSDPYVKGGNAPNVLEVVAEAMKELTRIRIQEQSQRPLRIVLQDPVHKPDDDLRNRFKELVDDELKVRRLNTRDWLRVATWWLLKARLFLSHSEQTPLTNARGSVSISTESKSPSNQAYVDLLKSSYILYDIILKQDNLTPLLTDENRVLFYNLSDGISEEFENFRFEIPEKITMYRQNLNVWEFLQPEEETYDQDDLLPCLENGRWITVDQADAGEEDEKVLFRTFVNAEIGGKRFRLRKKGAPYMLLLSTKEGDSEPKVTICNQSGTLCLQRDFKPEDIKDEVISTSPLTPMSPGMSSGESLPLNFGRMPVSISFPFESDLKQFMYIPKAYFTAVKKREPRELENCTETLLFKSSMELYEVFKASTMKPTNPVQKWQSCDLRVLETTHKEGWRTTRRIVVSSSAAEKVPWCIDYFVPLSRVQISRKGLSRQILVKWSDTGQERTRSDGSYNKIYSYVYDEGNPNLALCLMFRTQADATDFEKTLLELSLPPIFSWSHGPNARFIYNVSDTEPNPKQYKALLVTHIRHAWRYSEVYYMFRDSDYQHDHATLRIRFPQIHYSDYISTHTSKLFAPDRAKLPVFSHCEKKVGHVTVDFTDEHVSQSFMNSLTNHHELVFSRRSLWITTKAPSRFSSTKKSNKGPSEIQLWKKGNTMRLTSRWTDQVADKWMTMPVHLGPDLLGHQRDCNRASLPKCEVERGTLIDMASLRARSPRDKAEARRMGPVSIEFEAMRDRDEFLAALEGKQAPKEASPMEHLLDLRFDS